MKKKLLIGPNRFFSQFASRKRNRNKFSLKKSEDSKFEIGEYFIWWILCMIQLQHSPNIFRKKSKRKQSHNVQDHSSSQRYFWENLLQSRRNVWKSEGANSNPRPSSFWRRSFCIHFYQNLEGQLSPSPRFRRPFSKDVLQRFVCLSLEPSLRIAVSREKSAKAYKGFHFRYFSICSSFFLLLQNSKTKL